MTLLLIIMIVSIAVLYGPGALKQVRATEPSSHDVRPYLMKLRGGPADGHIEKIVEPERPLFFVATYPPKVDEDTGMPPEENIVGHMYGKLYIRPNYAYYRYVMEDEYIYVRDLEEKEVQNIAITGEQPLARLEGHDAEESD